MNKYINLSYQLYDITDGQEELLEETSADQPFVFISGMGVVLEAFEQQVIGLEPGAKFNFTLAPEQAYGAHDEARVLDLDKQLFYVDGQFDAKNVYQDAVIPLQNEDGNRFNGLVVEVSDDKVKIDLNHPLAGSTLNFRGEIVESREATNEEVAELAERFSGHGHHCGGHSGCGKHGHDHEGGCCGNHNHKDGECCGNHDHKDGGCCGNHDHKEGECCGNHEHKDGGCCGNHDHKEGGCCCNH